MDDTQTSTADDRPSSFSEHFSAKAESDSSSDAPETVVEDASSASAGTTDPQAAIDPAQATEAAGPVPFTRHQAAIENARAKAREEAAAEWKQYEWAKQIDRTQLQQALEMARRYDAAQGDPVQFLQELAQEIQAHPEHGARLRSFAAKALSSGRGQTQPQGSEIDNLVIDLGNGQTVAMADLKAQWTAEIEQKFQPVQATVAEFQAERAYLKAINDAQSFAGSTMQEAAQWPGMDAPENRLAVAEAIKAMQLTSDDPRDLQIALNAAWRQTVLPKLQRAGEQATVAKLQQKAVAQTVNPSRPAPNSGQRPRSFADLYAGRGR